MNQATTRTSLDELFDENADATDSQITLVEQYKLCIEMADRVSSRRQAANNFYLTVTTFLTGFVFAGSGTELIDRLTGLVLALATLSICVLWARSIKSYKDLNSGKFAVITEIEKKLPAKPFSVEWNILRRGADHSLYRPFNFIEKQIPFVFGIMMVLFILAMLIGWLSVSCAQTQQA